tara:strand:- start:1200 stop:2288 length:1089 start_codon:yes stop_codon:yes gene_type:complete
MAERNFFIQWDSTNDCNLRCSHCYHNREGEEHEKHLQDESSLMKYHEVISMIDDLNETSRRWKFKPRLQISGGEPMKRKDLFDILNYTKSLEMETRLLTNGTLITPSKANDLYDLGIRRLQVSLDGSKEKHNKIRGRPLAYELAMEGIGNCTDASIDVTVSMTAMQSNKQDFEDIVINSIGAGAKYVGFQSYVPDSELGLDDPEFVGPEETYDLFKETRRLESIYGDKIKILQTEVLWQLMQWDTTTKQSARESGKFLSGCGAGFSGLSVLSDGTVYPCRRLPIPIGHISQGIGNIMIDNEVLNNLRDLDEMKRRTGCEHVNYCRGCRAVAYAITGDYLSPDPMCFKGLVQLNDIEPRVIRR